jgi:hypothetical protein
MTWTIVIFVTVLYIQLFNRVADLYFDSGRTLTLHDVYRKFVPPTDVHIHL